jgi:sugar lactone lactonase YvrE
MLARVEEIIPLGLRLGESPIWDAEERALWFVDCERGMLFRRDVVRRKQRDWSFPETLSAIGLCGDGRLLLALRRSVALFDPANGRVEKLVEFVEEPADNRLNDGKVSPDGSFWVGSMDADRTRRRPSGALYRVTADGRYERKVDGFKVSNGLAWSGDGLTLFHADSHGAWIRKWKHEPGTGRIEGGTLFAQPDGAVGRPDGAAMDRAGHYWSAGVSAGCINRYAPDGTLADRIPLPVAHPTMPCFAGDDLRTLWVTSMGRGGGCGDGALLRLTTGAEGVPVARFAAAG